MRHYFVWVGLIGRVFGALMWMSRGNRSVLGIILGRWGWVGMSGGG